MTTAVAPPAAPERLRRAAPLLAVLLPLFFLSGISGLTYEVVWLRVLGHVFGVMVWAASTVLASFMAGLALGGYLGGRFAGRARSPLRWYGVAEILVGASAVATPAVFAALERFYVGLYPALPGEMFTLTLVRFPPVLRRPARADHARRRGHWPQARRAGDARDAGPGGRERAAGRARLVRRRAPTAPRLRRIRPFDHR
jgi:hypothetical protein